MIIAVMFYIFSIGTDSEIFNAITAFVVIDISNTERRNLNIVERIHFYDSISLISKAIVSGFTAPLFYILLMGNGMGIVYVLLYNIAYFNKYSFIRILSNTLTIVPSILVQIPLYVTYWARNRKLSIDFKGDYLMNCITRPLLNVDIFGAYIESVNFYCYFNDNDVHYVKSYGEYTNRIDRTCVKDYLSITYGIAMIYYVVFFLVQRAI